MLLWFNLSPLLVYFNGNNFEIFGHQRQIGEFCTMSVFSRFWKKLNRSVVYSAKNPDNFNEIFGIKTTPFRMFSLFLLAAIMFVFIGVFFVAPMFRESRATDFSRNKLNLSRLSDLEQELSIQENYINDVKTILSGGKVELIKNDTIINRQSINVDTIDHSFSADEKELAVEVEKDLISNQKKKKISLNYFVSPVKGIVSEKYSKNHFGIDIVVKANTAFKSCLDGVVIYRGYSVNDGNVVIVKHSGNYISVYKHAKSIFKKIGDKVGVGDPLGIVGNSGKNSTGPHLHFEVWQNQKVVDPEKLMSFKS